MKRWFWPAAMRLLTTVCAGGLAASLVGLSAAAGAPAPSPPSHTYSSGLCAWLQLHSNQARGATCLNSNALGADRAGDAGAAARASRQKNHQDAQAARSASNGPQFGSNVDATNFNEDVAAGQSETAIAAQGRYVLSGWNDASGFLIADSTNPQGSLTSVGFSADGGKTFTDMLLPNNDPCQRIFGDPTIVSYRAPNGTVFFYVGSLYLSEFSGRCPSGGNNELSLSVGTVSGNTISFDNPVVVANGGNFQNFPTSFQGFLDKDWVAIDPARGKLVVDYACYGPLVFPGGPPLPPNTCSSGGDIDIALCDILADPAHPACNPGNTGPAYMTVAVPPPAPAPSLFLPQEQLEGAYDSFSAAGDLYLAWSQNWGTNLSMDGDPFVHQVAARVPQACLKGVACSKPPNVSIEDAVKSLDSVVIPGYSRGIGNDFPRIAFNDKLGKVAIAWNEANAHPLGDIVLVTASADLTSVGPKVRVNDDNAFALHFLPALSVARDGTMNLSWYDRRQGGPTTALTDVFAASIHVGDDGGNNVRVTTVATDWLATGSLSNPNFGDYTDNTTDGATFYINWSDGRVGVPNSFVASAQGHNQD